MCFWVFGHMRTVYLQITLRILCSLIRSYTVRDLVNMTVFFIPADSVASDQTVHYAYAQGDLKLHWPPCPKTCQTTWLK